LGSTLLNILKLSKRLEIAAHGIDPLAEHVICYAFIRPTEKHRLNRPVKICKKFLMFSDGFRPNKSCVTVLEHRDNFALTTTGRDILLDVH
jgi:hypothetical protein